VRCWRVAGVRERGAFGFYDCHYGDLLVEFARGHAKEAIGRTTMSISTPRLSFAAVAAGFAIASGTVAAQTPEIVVEAPRVQHTDQGAPGGAQVDIISVTHRVSYKDLDIATTAGARALEQRVKDAASAACKEIDKLYPMQASASSYPSCEKAAVDKAMVQERAAIAAAEKAHK
jgi:UrcA family protein